MRKLLWGLSALLLATSQANAAPIVFNYGQAGTDTASIVKVDAGSGITATATATAANAVVVFPITVTPPALLTRNSTGLGVTWNGTIAIPIIGPQPISDTDPTQVDNFGPHETVKFALSSKLILDYVKFQTTTPLGIPPEVEQWGLSVDGGAPVNLGGLATINPLGNTGLFTIDITSLPVGLRTGTTFVIFPQGDGSDFRINELGFDAVPEPATMAVFSLMAIGGLGYVRRRKLAA